MYLALWKVGHGPGKAYITMIILQAVAGVELCVNYECISLFCHCIICCEYFALVICNFEVVAPHLINIIDNNNNNNNNNVMMMHLYSANIHCGQCSVALFTDLKYNFF